MTFSPRPPIVSGAVTRPGAPPQLPTPQQVPMQGVVRVSTPPVAQSPVQVPTPPPTTVAVPVSGASGQIVVSTAAPVVPSVPIPKPGDLFCCQKISGSCILSLRMQSFFCRLYMYVCVSQSHVVKAPHITGIFLRMQRSIPWQKSVQISNK
jgi:hypothetical protein